MFETLYFNNWLINFVIFFLGNMALPPNYKNIAMTPTGPGLGARE